MPDQQSAAEQIASEVRVPSPNELDLGDSDPKASKEASDIAQDRDLDRERAIGDHDRSEGLRSHFYSGCVVGLWTAMIAVIFMFAIYIHHLVSPDDWQWLSEERISQIKSMLFSGAVGGFIVQYFRKVL